MLACFRILTERGVDGTDAAAAARLSKGFATVVKESRPRKSTMKIVMTPRRSVVPDTYCSVHRGDMSIKTPRRRMMMFTKRSIFSSDV